MRVPTLRTFVIGSVLAVGIAAAGGGDAYASPPNPSLSLKPASIFEGQSAKLSWNSGPDAHLNSCWTDGQFSNSYTVPGYWVDTWICAGWFGCFPWIQYVPPQTVENPSGSVTVAPANTTTYSYACNRTETFSIGASCYGYSTNGVWGWGYCWAGQQEAQALCQQRGYASATTYVARGPAGRVCGGGATNWSDWRCDGSCKTCGGKTLTSITCKDGPVVRYATVTVSAPPADGCPGTPGCPENPLPQTLPSGTGNDDDGSCPVNAHRDSANACVCDAGLNLQGNVCVVPAQCSDGIDNDGNGSADFAGAAGLPPDTGCSSLNDNDESVPDAELTLTPDKKIVKPGTAVVLTWGGAHIKNGSCALRGDNDESWNLPAGEGGGVGGSQLTGKLTAETRFTLTCISLKTNSAISASAVVKVVPSFKEF